MTTLHLRKSLLFTPTMVAIAIVTAGFAVVFARVPWPRIDLYNNLQRAEDLDWTETVRAAFGAGVEYRPLLVLATKFSYVAAGLHPWFYKMLVLAQFGATLWLLLVIFMPSGPKRALAAVVALSCAIGLHTSRILFLFLPLNGYSAAMLLVLGTVWMVAQRPPERQWVFLPLTLAALLCLELGILIVPVVLIGWWLSAPGITRSGVLATVAGVGIYFVTRTLFGASVGDLSPPESGLGFDDISPQQIKLTFAHAPWLFWLYNVGSSLLTVLVSEPRAGKFKFVSALLRGAAAQWQWLHVLSSLVTTAVIVGVLGTVRTLAPRDRLIAAMGAGLLLCGSGLGFLYTRDRIGLASGLGYAMLVYVALSALLERSSASTIRRTLATLLVALLGVCWIWRAGEAGLQLRDRAWQYYLEWTVRYHHEGEETPLFRELREAVVAHRPPNPRRDPQWTYRWFEREFDRMPPD